MFIDKKTDDSLVYEIVKLRCKYSSVCFLTYLKLIDA